METHYSLYQSAMIVWSFMIGIGVPPSWEPQHGRISRQILFTIWLLAATVLYLSYCQELLSQLITVAFDKPIDYSRDVLESGIPLVMYKDTTFVKVFQNSHNPTMREVLRKNVIEKNALVVWGSPQMLDFLFNKLRIGEGNVDIEVI